MWKIIKITKIWIDKFVWQNKQVNQLTFTINKKSHCCALETTYIFIILVVVVDVVYMKIKKK